MSIKRRLRRVGLAAVIGLGSLVASSVVQAAGVPFEWNPTTNVKVALHGYGIVDFYSMNRGDESFGSGALDSQDLRSNVSNAYLIMLGSAYDWKYAFSYNFAGGSTNENGIIWAWISHSLGSGNLFIGQHWDFGSLEEPLSMKNVMFSDRNLVSSSGLSGISNHGQGLFYQASNPYGSGHNNIFLGAAAFSLNNSTVNGTPVDTEGWGANAAIRWAPVVKNDKWVQFGGAVTYNQSERGAALTSFALRYSGPDELKHSFASFAKTNPNVPPPFRNSADDPKSVQYTLSATGSYGRFFFLGEYGLKQYSRDRLNPGDPENINVDAYALEAGFWLTGETTPFSRRNGSYGTPKPLHESGAVQLIAGIDGIQNNKVSGSHLGGTVGCFPAVGSPTGNVTNCSLTRYRVGLNYWANPNVRFLAQIGRSVLDLGDAGKDKPTTFTLRAQFQF